MSADPVRAERDRIRATIRARRRELTPSQRAEASQRIAHLAQASGLLRPGRRIAVYLAQGSEVDCGPLIELARRRRCILYLPRITSYRQRRMEFVRFCANTPLRVNRHGIAEPIGPGAPRIALRSLDLVFLPLVAFDSRGWRLGSGAGYYDRRLQSLLQGGPWRRPRLIGVAYEFQRVPPLAPARWDVPMDAVITDAAMHRTQRPASCDERGERRPAVREDS
jgi:5-formyltetrahydrofolate cyclo-ligase